MQDNESLREFVKRFGQAVLQVEACRMDAILQIFKRSIRPSTPFLNHRQKPPTTMDDLFKRANKYSMLEDDVRAATQQVMVAGQAARGGAERNAKLPDRPRPSDRRQEGPKIVVRDVPSTRIMGPSRPKAVINYINGGLFDEEYDSKRKGVNCCGRINTRTH
ncbi:hypothetical protein AAG906_005444 [Vitis piasezkii]